MTDKHHPYVVKGTVANNLSPGLTNDENIAACEKLLKEVVFGKLFKNHMTRGFNLGLVIVAS